MTNPIALIALLVCLLPLLASVVAGLAGSCLGRVMTHRFAIGCVAVSFLLSCYLFTLFVLQNSPPLQVTWYTWATAGVLQFDVAFLIDRLSTVMLVVVSFISLMVHLYTIGYMRDDPSYTRFFSYVSLFTFAMIILVLANNFLLLFFGWEGVGLVSYLLIGFWFKRETANQGSLKAFLVNRVGDIGFILAIAAVLMHCDTLNYTSVFAQANTLTAQTISLFGHSYSIITLICLLLFIGAMAKSAQVPLHVWLPESMEGPTPISALIHAATMVTAGIYMVARMSPLFEHAQAVLTLILVLGGTTAFFMGLLALTQYDIKRVIAYSTISQLGYMAVALGASAYSAAIFHLITHAFFKALLFLAAGSVIIAMHHEQDMRKMGGLATYLPVTYLTFLIGALALSAIPPFSGFYSKDMIIDAVRLSTVPGAQYAYWCVLAGAFVTPLYTFRALFMTFHGECRVEAAKRSHLHEANWVVWVPLVLLAIPSFAAGALLIHPMLFATNPILGQSVTVLPTHDVLKQLEVSFHGTALMALQANRTCVFWLALAGIVVAWAVTMQPAIGLFFKTRFKWIYAILVRKFGFDDFNQTVMVQGTRGLGEVLYKVADEKVIDGAGVNGIGKAIRYIAATARHLQTGYLYHYALVMVIGVVAFLAWMVWG